MLRRIWIKFIRLLWAVRKTHAESGTSRIYTSIYLIKLFFQYRIDPEEAFVYGLLKPPIPPPNHFISKAELSSIQETINPLDLFLLTEDKTLFHRFCKGWNIPTPKVIAFFFKDSRGLFQDRMVCHRHEWIDRLQDIKSNLIIKPARGHHGIGVRGFIWSEGLWKSEEKTFSPEQLYDWMDCQNKSLIIQELLYCHPSIEALTGSRACQTIRLMTLRSDSGVVFANVAGIKFISGSNLVDNFHHGRTGNIVARINIESGMIVDAVGPMCPGGGFKHINSHPVTGKDIIGYQVPQWEEVLKETANAAISFSPLATVGWDVAVTHDSVLIVEGNFRYDPTFFNLFGAGIDVRNLLKTC